MNRKNFFTGLAGLTLGACHVITNNDGDFEIDSEGIELDTGPSVITPSDPPFTAIRWTDGVSTTGLLIGHENLSGDVGMQIYGDDFVHIRSNDEIILDADGDEIRIISADNAGSTPFSENGFITIRVNGSLRRIKTFDVA